MNLVRDVGVGDAAVVTLTRKGWMLWRGWMLICCHDALLVWVGV
jgi:hypothetical protein